MPMKDGTTIGVTKAIVERFKAHGISGDSAETILRRLLDVYDLTKFEFLVAPEKCPACKELVVLAGQQVDWLLAHARSTHSVIPPLPVEEPRAPRAKKKPVKTTKKKSRSK